MHALARDVDQSGAMRRVGQKTSENVICSNA
jgi:hypothetical protein